MNISESDLKAEYVRARHDWPFIDIVEQRYGLPARILYAVGSRETNLRNVVGDGGHGNGVWQLDNRSHTIPAKFNTDVLLQATVAASMLRASIDHFHGNIRATMVAYNAGQGTADSNLIHRPTDLDHGTANGDYSTDTYARMLYLQTLTTPLPPPVTTETDTDMFLILNLGDKQQSGIWLSGGVGMTSNDNAARQEFIAANPKNVLHWSADEFNRAMARWVR